MKTFKLLLACIIVVTLIFSACEKNQVEAPQNSPELKSGHADNKGFDQWGFNWQAQQFKGYLLNALCADHMAEAAPFYKKYLYTGQDDELVWVGDMFVGGGVDFIEQFQADYPDAAFAFIPFYYWVLPKCMLEMHWNDALVSKDGVYPDLFLWFDTDAWITMKYYAGEGSDKWWHFRKLVSIKNSYHKGDGVNEDTNKYYDENGNEVGLVSKYYDANGLMIIQVVNSGPVNTELFYEEYKSPLGAGMGKF